MHCSKWSNTDRSMSCLRTGRVVNYCDAKYSDELTSTATPSILSDPRRSFDDSVCGDNLLERYSDRLIS